MKYAPGFRSQRLPAPSGWLLMIYGRKTVRSFPELLLQYLFRLVECFTEVPSEYLPVWSDKDEEGPSADKEHVRDLPVLRVSSIQLGIRPRVVQHAVQCGFKVVYA